MHVRRSALVWMVVATLGAACDGSTSADGTEGTGAGGPGSGGSPAACSSYGFYSGPCDTAGLTCVYADVSCQGTWQCDGTEWQQVSMECFEPGPEDCGDVAPSTNRWLRSDDDWGGSSLVAANGSALASWTGNRLRRLDPATGEPLAEALLTGVGVPGSLRARGTGWVLTTLTDVPVDLGGFGIPAGPSVDVAVLSLDDELAPLDGFAFGAATDGFWGQAPVAPLASGDLVVAASLEGATDVAGPVQSQGGDDVVLGRFDASGNGAWGHLFGSQGNDFPAGVGVLPDGSIVMAGLALEAMSLGGATQPGDYSMFVGRYGEDGQHLWSKTCSADTIATDLVVGADGGIYVAGAILGVAFDCGGTVRSAPDGTQFVARFDADGGEEWVQLLVGEGYVSASLTPRLALHPDGGVVVAHVELGQGHDLTHAQHLEASTGARIGPDHTVPTFGVTELYDVAVVDDGTIVVAGGAKGALCTGEAEGIADPSYLVAF